MTKRDPVQVDWDNELDLLSEMNVNFIGGWIWFDHAYMEEVCIESGGEIKKHIGGDIDYMYRVSDPYPRCPTQFDILNLGYWLWYECYAWPDQDWKDGYLRAVEHWVDTVDTLYTDDVGVAGYSLAHEFTHGNDGINLTYKKYDTIDFMAATVDTVDTDPDHFTSMVDGPRDGVMPIKPFFPDSVPNLDVFEFFHYPYIWSVLKISGESFQEVVDQMTVWYDSMHIILTEPNKMPWIATIQTITSMHIVSDDSACACIPILDGVDTVGGYWSGWNVEPTYDFRLPSREEMRLQTFLAISRGAKGALTFVFGPSVAPGFGPMIGLLDYNGGAQDVRREWFPNSPDDPDNFYTPYAFNYDQGVSLYDHVAELFREIEEYGPLLVKLRATAIASYGVPDTLAWVNGNASDWLVQLTDTTYGDTAVHYWEASTFIDTSVTDSTDYLMFVNRVTSTGSSDNDTSGWAPASYREVAAIFTRPTNYYPVIQDIYTEEIWFLSDADSSADGKWWFTFADSVGPGDGNIYRITDVFKGPITDSTVLSHDVLLTRDLVIDTNGILVIDPGVTLYIYPDRDDNNQGFSDSTIEIITKGKIYANGAAYDSIRFVPFADSPEQGDWVGIYLDEFTSGEFSYCSIRYGDRGIEMRRDADVNVSHCHIGHNSTTGIYNYKGSLDLVHSKVANNGIYGLHGYLAADSVFNTKFADNVSYGIRIYGINASNDSTHILSDTITCLSPSSDPSLYGIKIDNNDRVRISNCRVQSYDQGGIYISGSDCIVQQSDLRSNVNYGVYVANSSNPYIRRCNLANLSIGVKSTGKSLPDIGVVSSVPVDSGLCDFEGCTQWFIYHDWLFGPNILMAEANYFGVGVPDTSKFYGPIDYIPYITIDPFPKVTIDQRVPYTFMLRTNYPNPFNPRTTISFTLDQAAHTMVTIYNLLGQNVVTLADEYLGEGEHTVIWDGKNSSGVPVASGIYFYAIQSGEHFDSKKMTILR
jgi:parallel beta-helix repeat protein